MTAIKLAEIFKQVQQAYRLYDEGKVSDAKTLALQIEAQQTAYSDEFEKALCRKYAASCLIDIGTAVDDEAMVKRGTSYFREWLDSYAGNDDSAHELYNLANGYFSSWKFNSAKLISDAIDAEEHNLARHYYRQSIQELQPKHYTDGFACQVWTNYGNSLDTVGRSIEAIEAYDAALRIDPEMGMALGNKGIAVSYLAPIMHGHAHLFYLEAIRLLQKALEQSLPRGAKVAFGQKLAQLNGLLKDHGEMQPEEVERLEPVTDFQRFLYEWCARHRLFLNPVTFLGENERTTYYGDPMFITKMYAPLEEPDKFDRYVTFLVTTQASKT